MRVLVTGHKGFIGSHMLSALEAADHEVSTYEWGESLPSIKDQDWVIHIGAISSTTEKDVDKVLHQNLDFSIQLYEACKLYGVRMQYSSSASVYGFGKEFKETSPVDPRTPYAWSKYLFERHVTRNPSKYTVQGFRYFNVHGPGEEHKGTQASPFTQFKRQADLYGMVSVFEGSENYRRDFIHVDQVVDAHIKFLSIDESGIWNVGTGNTQSFLDVALSFNVPIKTIPMPESLRHSYQEYTCADMTKFKKAINGL